MIQPSTCAIPRWWQNLTWLPIKNGSEFTHRELSRMADTLLSFLTPLIQPRKLRTTWWILNPRSDCYGSWQCPQQWNGVGRDLSVELFTFTFSWKSGNPAPPTVLRASQVVMADTLTLVVPFISQSHGNLSFSTAVRSIKWLKASLGDHLSCPSGALKPVTISLMWWSRIKVVRPCVIPRDCVSRIEAFEGSRHACCSWYIYEYHCNGLKNKTDDRFDSRRCWFEIANQKSGDNESNLMKLSFIIYLFLVEGWEGSRDLRDTPWILLAWVFILWTEKKERRFRSLNIVGLEKAKVQFGTLKVIWWSWHLLFFSWSRDPRDTLNFTNLALLFL